MKAIATLVARARASRGTGPWAGVTARKLAGQVLEVVAGAGGRLEPGGDADGERVAADTLRPGCAGSLTQHASDVPSVRLFLDMAQEPFDQTLLALVVGQRFAKDLLSEFNRQVAQLGL